MMLSIVLIALLVAIAYGITKYPDKAQAALDAVKAIPGRLASLKSPKK